MPTPAATESIGLAFANDVNLRKRIFDAIESTPQYVPLFDDIAKYHLASQQFSLANGKSNGSAEHPSKKRRLEDGAVAVDASLREIVAEAKDVSFSLPQRKKLHLSVNQYGSDPDVQTTKYTISARNPASDTVEFEYPTTTFDYALRVLVPEKAQKQYNYCLLSKGQSGEFSAAIIWTVNVGSSKPNQPPSSTIEAGIALGNALDTVLRRSGNKLVTPSESEFASTLVESHRKNEKAYHVKAFRGSKDGYLYFLENGIFFGFKKPLAFFPFVEIDSISYTAVLQRTFNLVIVVRLGNDTDAQDTQEIEFSMIDQADFGGIDAYIKKHQLQDSSMADARRAKKFNVNGAKGETVEGEQNDGESELQKAEQELEDEEDELEEDYDPGSDGESEGSESSDDDDDYEYSKGKGKTGKDLVKEELGSEAEDVEVTEDEGEDEAAEDEEDEDEEMEEEEQVQEQPAPKVTAKPVVHPAPIPRYGAPDIDDENQL